MIKKKPSLKDKLAGSTTVDESQKETQKETKKTNKK